MKPVTRLIALLLTLAICVGCVPMAAAQEEETARLEGMSGRYEGTNDFGRLLAAELQGDFDQEDPTWVSDIKVEEGIAHVTVNAERDVLLLIGAYDENSGALLTSATVSAGSLDSEVSVALPELPAFYELKVFVLEPESYEPLCGCENLMEVELPDGLVSLGAYAFQACEALSEIDLGQSLEILGGWSLKGTAVRSVTVPATVTAVGNCAFAECELLDTVTFMGDAPSFGRQTFSETETVAYYPSNRSGWTAEVLQDYEGTVTWIPFEAPAASQSAPARRQGEKAVEKSVSGLSNSARYLLVVAHSLEEPLLTREQIATILWRYMGCPEAEADLSAFGDAASVSPYAADAINWAVSEGIMNGDGKNLNPLNSATRAEFACMFTRMVEGE